VPLVLSTVPKWKLGPCCHYLYGFKKTSAVAVPSSVEVPVKRFHVAIQFASGNTLKLMKIAKSELPGYKRVSFDSCRGSY